MLREAGKQKQVALEMFLDRHAHAMPRTMLRYAIERFEPAARVRYLTRPEDATVRRQRKTGTPSATSPMPSSD